MKNQEKTVVMEGGAGLDRGDASAASVLYEPRSGLKTRMIPALGLFSFNDDGQSLGGGTDICV